METLLVTNALICDGLGGKPYIGSLLVRGGRIAAVGAVPPTPDILPAQTLDAAGMALCPGFIDLHRHCDFAALRPNFGALELAQGITTAVCGPCGMSAFPSPRQHALQKQYAEFLRPCLGLSPFSTGFADLPAYATAVQRTGLPLNLGSLIGAGAVQVAVNGFSSEPLSSYGLAQAQALISDALDAGALGMSMGIMYVPECYLPRWQRLALLKPLQGKGTLYCHIRGEGDLLVDSVQEVLHLARQAQIPLQISHFKAVGIRNWGDGLLRAIERIEAARACGQDVTVDFYPYTGGSTTLFSLVPPLFMEHGSEQALARFATKEGRAEFDAALASPHPGWDNMVEAIGPERIVLSSSAAHPWLEGQTLAAICRTLGEKEPGSCIGRLLVESEGQAGIILMSMHPDDLCSIARLPYSMLISDSLYAESGRPHPRLYDSFPRFLQDFCGSRGPLSFEKGIEKLTSLPARRAGLTGRGTLVPGGAADFVLFDPKALQSGATFAQPAQLTQGLSAAFISGKQVWGTDGLLTERPGVFLQGGYGG